VFSGSATIRFLASFGNVFLSLILGAIAMFLFLLYLPDQSAVALRVASAVKEWTVAHSGSSRIESILRFVLQDAQLLLIGFVLTVRLIIGLAILLAVVSMNRFKALVVRGGPAPAAAAAAPKDR
jgi:hypothetical protein